MMRPHPEEGFDLGGLCARASNIGAGDGWAREDILGKSGIAKIRVSNADIKYRHVRQTKGAGFIAVKY